ncbi:MAG: MerC domain-containing protein [Chthoniobacterales bacterium]|nr:MerC domain-containing protein [Chthoniobacterales bacterium]
MKRVIHSLDQIGSVGALLAAVAAPCCFPLFAALAATFGLGALGRFETTTLYFFQGFALVALIGLALSYRKHRQLGPVAAGLLGGLAVAYSFYWDWRIDLLYAGLTAIGIASVWNWFCSRGSARSEPVLESVITCPSCGHRSEETMPTNACLFFYDCTRCNTRLKPKPGDCCVFCSYGSVPCPPIQIGLHCCAQ